MIAILKMKNTCCLLEDLQEAVFLPGSNKGFSCMSVPMKKQKNCTEGNDDVNNAVHFPDPMWDQPGTSGQPSGIFKIII